MAEIFDLRENQEEVTYAGETKTITRLLNVRKTPSLNADVVRILQPGDTVKVYETLGEWSQIGENQFVMTEFLK